MSSSDIFDVLNIKPKTTSPNGETLASQQSSSPGLGTKNTHTTPLHGSISSSTIKANVPKPQVTGIQRELYNLLGENQPPVMIQPANRFKEKMTGKPSPWTYVEFWSNDKEDPKKRIKLRHWVKGSKELVGNTPQASSFSKFNQHLTLPQFTREEYDAFMEVARERNNVKTPNTSNQSPTPQKNDKATDNTTANKKVDIESKDTTDPSRQVAKKEDGSGTTHETVDQKDSTNTQSTLSSEDNNPGDKADKIMELKDPKVTELEEDWSFDEVDYLFQLCRKYDLRWFIIYDRYQFDTFKHRTLEDLKAKFYEMCQNYFAARNSNDPLLQSLNYEKEKEMERKQYLQRLLSRSAAEIAEEEALIIESKKFEMAAKKTLNERESLLRLLDSPNSDQDVSQYMSSQGISQLYSNLLADKSRKRKNDSTIPENPWMKQQQQFAQQKQRLQQLHEKRHSESSQSISSSISNAQKAEGTKESSLMSPAAGNGAIDSISPRKTKKQKQELQNAIKRKSEAEYAEHLLKNFTAEEKKSLGVIAHGEKLSPGVYLRSTKISTFKPALQNKVVAILQELGLPTRPSMPSYDVIQIQEKLLRQIVTLLELKKQLDKTSAEHAIRK